MVGSIVLFAILAVAGLWIAQRQRFFSYPHSYERGAISFWHFIGGALLYLAAMVLAAGLLRESQWMQLVATTIGLAILLAWVLGLRLKIWGQRSPWHAMAIGALTYLVAFPLSAAIGLLVELVVEKWIGAPLVDQIAVEEVKETLKDPILFTFTSLMVIVIVPMAEEILFRGLLQSWLRRYLSVIPTICLSAVIFAGCHLAPAQGWSNLQIFAVLLVLGLFLGHVYERQQSLWASIALHAAYNGISVLAMAVAA